MHKSAPSNWFDCLRREARLFLAVAVAALSLNLLQPLAAAASMFPDGLVLCTASWPTETGQDDREPRRNAECPLCIAGHACAGPIAAKAGVKIASAPGPAETTLDAARPYGFPVPTARHDATPPSIRAPPFPMQ